MKTLVLYVPLESPVSEFVRTVRLFKDAGYRFADAVIREEIVGVTFQKIEVIRNGNEESAPA